MGLCISHSLVLWRADLRALSSCVPAEACCATYTTASSVKGGRPVQHEPELGSHPEQIHRYWPFGHHEIVASGPPTSTETRSLRTSDTATCSHTLQWQRTMPLAACATSCSRKCSSRADHLQRRTMMMYDHTRQTEAPPFSASSVFSYLYAGDLYPCRTG
eukprot:jgi/Undpi1/5472/HiC_scaffold_2.g00751.m1